MTNSFSLNTALLVTLLAVLLPRVASSAPGEVNSLLKIADGLSGLPNGTLANGNLFGSSCTTLGDLDGDGIPEIAVGARLDNTKNGVADGGNENGAVYILFLNADGSIKSQRKIADGLSGLPNGTIASGDAFGFSCASLGDLDGDGIPELAVGAFGDDTINGGTSGSIAGAIHILFLNANGTVKSHRKIADGLNDLPNGTIFDNDQFGASCTNLGDLDGDGNPELAVGAVGDNTVNGTRSGTFTLNGAVHVLFLNADGSVKSHRKIADGLSGIPNGTISNNDVFGFSCIVLDDLDGDGVPELAVGATGDRTANGSTGGASNGAAYVLFLNVDGTVKSHQKLADGLNGIPNGTIDNGDSLGISCAKLGDLDGDGVHEIAVGAIGDDTASGSATGDFNGALYVLFLETDGSVKSLRKLADGLNSIPNGTFANNSFFGNSCTPLGDLSGDGIPEIVVGAAGDSTGGDSRGALYILSLGDLPITVTTAADEFNTPSGANLSLREAIRDAGDTGEFRDIRFDPSLTGQTITLGSELAIDGSSVRISGQDLPDGITISGNFASRVFNITNSSTVTLECLTLVDGSTTVGGGISNSSSTLFLRDVTIANCIASIFGGGISNNSVLTIERCTFYFNTATNGGAGIFNTGFMKAWNSTFALNETTGGNGGALFDSAGVTTLISSTTFLGNRASSAGEGIHAANGIVQLTNCIRTTEFDDLNQAGSGLIITEALTEAPLLDFLPPGYYRGKTPTSPLRPDTAAKNTGTFLPLPTTDQNGLPRNRNGGTDPGAAETIEFADNQPDNLIGEKLGKQKGNNLYNASGAGQNVKVKLKGSKKFKTFMTVQNDGITPDTITLRSNKPNKRTLKLKVIQLGGGNVTAALLRGLTLSDLAPGQSVAFRADYKRKSKTKKASGKILFTSTSSLFGRRDTVQAKVKSLAE